MPENGSGRERDRALAPSPPPGQGPVLFWFRLRRGYTLFIAVLASLVTALLMTLTVAHDALTVPVVQLIVLASVGIFYLIGRSERYSAGADWAGRGSRSWVRTYELVSVKASDDAGHILVIMKDSGGRTLLYRVKDVVDDDRRIWSYTYNGILHSVIAGGGETNEGLHVLLGVPYPESARTSEDIDADMDDMADTKPSTENHTGGG